MARRMHDDQLDLDAELVRRMLARRFPQWAELPAVRVDSSGTVNAMFRLGDEMVVRMPFVPGGAAGLAREAEWLPRLAQELPVPIPRVLGVGSPDDEYPYPWLVLDWLPGDLPIPGALDAPDLLASDLASFVRALRSADATGAPTGHRTGELAALDDAVHRCLREIRELGIRLTDPPIEAGPPIDTERLAAIWHTALDTEQWRGAPTWAHCDLLPGNVLVAEGRLSGVLDFAAAGVGDPACDLMAAWSILPTSARAVFRAELDVDDAAWARGRGWALAQAVIALPYYWQSNPGMASGARHVIGELTG